MDLVDFKGRTFIFYAISDQKTYSWVTYCTHNGPSERLITDYWNPGLTLFKVRHFLFNAINFKSGRGVFKQYRS